MPALLPSFNYGVGFLVRLGTNSVSHLVIKEVRDLLEIYILRVDVAIACFRANVSHRKCIRARVVWRESLQPDAATSNWGIEVRDALEHLALSLIVSLRFPRETPEQIPIHTNV